MCVCGNRGVAVIVGLGECLPLEAWQKNGRERRGAAIGATTHVLAYVIVPDEFTPLKPVVGILTLETQIQLSARSYFRGQQERAYGTKTDTEKGNVRSLRES